MNPQNINRKSWEVLTDEERTSLSLQFIMGKSSWESGEIMGKAHYKYLEIKQRAIEFVKLFTHHFDLYRDIFFPPDLKIDERVRRYFEETIMNRRSIDEAVREVNDPAFYVNLVREELVEKAMKKLEISQKVSERNFHQLIMEFDRWNNFRILPQSIQEPSGFKRRKKAKDKKHLYTWVNLPLYSKHRIIDKFEYKNRTDRAKHYGFSPILLSVDEGDYKTICVRTDQKNLDKLTSIGLFVFGREELAKEFCELTLQYLSKDKKHCVDGQKFWPLYRVLIQRCFNYFELQNISYSRRHINIVMRSWDKAGEESYREMQANKIYK